MTLGSLRCDYAKRVYRANTGGAHTALPFYFHDFCRLDVKGDGDLNKTHGFYSIVE